MTALSDLIARLEAAKEGSRELDATIFETVCDAELRPYSKGPRIRSKWWFKRGTEKVLAYGEDKHPQFTASLDAALTLVPVGWGAEIFWHDGATAADAYVDLRLPNPRWKEPDCPTELLSTYAALVSSYEDDDRPVDADEPHPLPRAKPLALALCIAAMKAREAAR